MGVRGIKPVEREVCGAHCKALKVSCTLPPGHDWPHVYENKLERISWEPRQSADLRRENERLRTELEARS